MLQDKPGVFKRLKRLFAPTAGSAQRSPSTQDHASCAVLENPWVASKTGDLDAKNSFRILGLLPDLRFANDASEVQEPISFRVIPPVPVSADMTLSASFPESKTLVSEKATGDAKAAINNSITGTNPFSM